MRIADVMRQELVVLEAAASRVGIDGVAFLQSDEHAFGQTVVHEGIGQLSDVGRLLAACRVQAPSLQTVHLLVELEREPLGPGKEFPGNVCLEDLRQCVALADLLVACRLVDDPPIEPLKDVQEGPPEPVVYFAYGSNMSTARLRERMPSCQPLGTATLPGHSLRFHKRSIDGSGKCNAFRRGNDHYVVGVLFRFDPAEHDKLDEAEGVGRGYEHAMVTVINEEGRRRKVLTYVATPSHIDDRLQPYGWYKEFVLSGAEEHGLPTEYVAEHIRAVEGIEDPNKKRDEKQRAILKRPQA